MTWHITGAAAIIICIGIINIAINWYQICKSATLHLEKNNKG